MTEGKFDLRFPDPGDKLEELLGVEVRSVEEEVGDESAHLI